MSRCLTIGLFISSLFFCSPSVSQKTWTLLITLKELHYKGLRNHTRPFNNVNIVVHANGNLTCNGVSGSDGVFSCSITEPPTKSSLAFTNLANYELVDSDILTNAHWLEKPDGPRDIFLICQKGMLQKVADYYAGRVIVVLKQRYDKQLTELQLNHTKQDSAYLGELARLQANFYAQTILAQKLSISFSKLDSAAPSSSLGQAMHYYFTGNFDSCYYFLNPDEIRRLGMKGKTELDRAADLSLLRADLEKGKVFGFYTAGPNIAKPTVEMYDSMRRCYCIAADSDYRLANELRECKDIFTLEKYIWFLFSHTCSRYLDDNPSTFIHYLYRCSTLLALDGGTFDDSVVLYWQFTTTYNGLSNADSAKYFSKALLQLGRRARTGNIRSQKFLCRYMDQISDDVPEELRIGVDTDQIRFYLSSKWDALRLAEDILGSPVGSIDSLDGGMALTTIRLAGKLLYWYKGQTGDADSALYYMKRAASICNATNYCVRNEYANEFGKELIEWMGYFDSSMVSCDKKNAFYREQIANLKAIQLKVKDMGVKSDIGGIIDKIKKLTPLSTVYLNKLHNGH